MNQDEAEGPPAGGVDAEVVVLTEPSRRRGLLRRPPAFLVGFLSCALVAAAIWGGVQWKSRLDTTSEKIEQAQDLLSIDVQHWIDQRLAGASTIGDSVRVGRFNVEALPIDESDPHPAAWYRVTNATDSPILKTDFGGYCLSARVSSWSTPSSWSADVSEDSWLAPGEAIEPMNCGLDTSARYGMPKEDGLVAVYDRGTATDQVVAASTLRSWPSPEQFPIEVQLSERIGGPLLPDKVRQVGDTFGGAGSGDQWERQSVDYWFTDVLSPGTLLVAKLAPDVEEFAGNPPADDGYCSSRWVAMIDLPSEGLMGQRSVALDRSGPSACMGKNSLIIGQVQVAYFDRPDAKDDE